MILAQRLSSAVHGVMIGLIFYAIGIAGLGLGGWLMHQVGFQTPTFAEHEMEPAFVSERRLPITLENGEAVTNGFTRRYVDVSAEGVLVISKHDVK